MALSLPRLSRKKAHASGPSDEVPVPSSRRTRLPLINRFSLRVQTRILLAGLALSLACTIFFMWLGSLNYIHATLQTHIASDLVMHSQRIGKAVPNAIQGNKEAFAQLAESRNEFNHGLALLTTGGAFQGYTIGPPGAEMKPVLDDVHKIWARTDRAADTILKLEKELTGFGVTLKRLNLLLPTLLDLSEQISMLQSQSTATPREVTAASQLVLLTLRLGRSANEFLTSEGVNPETAFLLGKDVNTFHDIIDGFLNGSELLRLKAVSDKETRDKLIELEKVFGEYQPRVAGILGNLQNFIAAKQSEQLVFLENEMLKKHLTMLQTDYRVVQESRSWAFWAMLAAVACGLLSSVGIALVQLQSSRNNAADAEARRQDAETQRLQAQQQEEKAMRTNVANQAAILRLMNELQKVADGDLTVHTTVSEDITGAIADSVNYTVEALRGLVEQVTQMASKVAATSDHVRNTTVGLSTAARTQARRIQDTGQSMLQMSMQITDISVSATESADVARHSVVVAERGAKAVEDAVKAMNEIREQIQETSKRIKRLGESSQVIGEITELISDITEQTNVLALNAAIQAASAGEAGRGFSVVAEEVQRLAERSSAATREIGALVRMIQTDTHDAVAAMEKSTAGVVEGAVLSDAAGAALADIRSVSNQLAELIHGMSQSTEEQAVSANGVAQNIQSILTENEIIEQSREQVSGLYNELWGAAKQLESSVSRFRVTVS
ncbi:methyl-accepting chemotaxis protein [Herbaspirillum sp. LeCh32-8]|uniref:methyl-accepting chemotaxis protein n=1 Tax=Herbaspirillum sp. LeCh32-8 TaxID=2821356 RepID=UPI001AE39F20|nr:methyl-accepting chemotaxis protein [Herbaspirillum sp. LeCh32-8]MBP0600484.1 methyl-accepting chemotaxis protein [Herbaspirillum sp. LeCh32-8]